MGMPPSAAVWRSSTGAGSVMASGQMCGRRLRAAATAGLWGGFVASMGMLRLAAAWRSLMGVATGSVGFTSRRAVTRSLAVRRWSAGQMSVWSRVVAGCVAVGLIRIASVSFSMVRSGWSRSLVGIPGGFVGSMGMLGLVVGPRCWTGVGSAVVSDLM